MPHGGGRRTNENGLRLERGESSLMDALAAAGCRDFREPGSPRRRVDRRERPRRMSSIR